MTYYEIDPLVRDISYSTDEYFTFITDAQKRGTRMDIVMGDARLTLNEFKPAEKDKYGILVLSAFSSDSIPIHLLTREALAMYLDKVTEDGILAFVISNRYLNIESVLGNLCQSLGAVGYIFEDPEGDELGKAASRWVIIARKPEYLNKLPLEVDEEKKQNWRTIETDPAVGVWTDDYSNLLKVFMR